MNLSSKQSPQQFWKLLDKIAPKSKTRRIKISVSQNGLTTKSILNSKSTVELPPGDGSIGPLDYKITIEELTFAASLIKTGKSPGLDNITTEMIICTLQYYPNIFLSLFNKVLEKGGSIPAIVPIFKNGNYDDPNSYQGISLLSSLGKLFYGVLNNRLLRYCREKSILSPSQFGFLPGNRTTDAHLMIYNLLCKYCHRNNMKIYGCFVDFSKAFDSVPMTLRRYFHIELQEDFLML